MTTGAKGQLGQEEREANKC